MSPKKQTENPRNLFTTFEVWDANHEKMKEFWIVKNEDAEQIIQLMRKKRVKKAEG